jgi:hypothetical protein
MATYRFFKDGIDYNYVNTYNTLNIKGFYLINFRTEAIFS